MGVKEVVLGVGVVGVALFPLFYTPTGTTSAPLPPSPVRVELMEGGFKYFGGGELEKRGGFQRVALLKNGYYRAENFWVEELQKGYKGAAVKGIFYGKGVNLTDFTLITDDYRLESKWGHYSTEGKWLKGGRFRAVGPSFIGRGEQFQVWADKRIVAKKVHYTFKVGK